MSEKTIKKEADWKVLEETSPSGKRLFQCLKCGHKSVTPDKVCWGCPLDWDKAEECLKDCERAYTSIGTPGTFVLLHVLQPLRTRFNSGERTRKLHDAIKAVKV